MRRTRTPQHACLFLPRPPHLPPPPSLPCPEGAVCDDRIDGQYLHNTQLTLRLNATYWRASNATADVHVCSPPYACDEPVAVRCNASLGEPAHCWGDALCNPHHEGVKCGVCSAGAYRHLDGSCLPCEEAAVLAVVATVLVFATMIGLALLAWRRYWRASPERRRHLNGLSARVQRKVRLIISFVQVVSQLHTAFVGLRFPIMFEELLRWLPVLGLDLFGVLGTLGCIVEQWWVHLRAHAHNQKNCPD